MVQARKSQYYYTKSLLPIEGRLIAELRVSSRVGTSIEHGESQSINVKTGRKFMLSKVITQAIFGHLKKKRSTFYSYLNNNSGDRDFLDKLQLNITIQEYTYAYPKFSGVKRYKTINVKGKRYVQEWTKKNNRYVFSSRTKVNYDSKKKLDNTAKQYEMI